MNSTPKPEDLADREAKIREVAHQLWEAEGCPHGQADRHWFQACEMLESGVVGMLPSVPVDDPHWLKRQEDEKAAASPLPQPVVTMSGRPVHEQLPASERAIERSGQKVVPKRQNGAGMI